MVFKLIRSIREQTRGNFLFLLAALAVFLVVSPLIHNKILLSASLLVILLGAIRAVAGNPRTVRVAMAFAALSLLSSVAAVQYDTAPVRLFGALVYVVFFSVTFGAMLGHVLSPGSVTVNKIAGGICVYVLIAIVAAFLFAILDEVDPKSFKGLRADNDVHTFSDAVYFSFVTLTTLGYGDITPQTPLARNLCAMLAVIGQIYLTVLVAALVALHIGERISSRERERGS